MEYKKTININFEGFWPDFSYKDFICYRILTRYFDVNLTNKPDYLFCSDYGEKNYFDYSYLSFKGIRIYMMAEVFFPNFNISDYAISAFDISCYDRSFFLPCFLLNGNIEKLTSKKVYTKEDLKEKSKFCNMLYSHKGYITTSDGVPMREHLFNILSQYKHIDSAGMFMNNMNGFVPGKYTKDHYALINQSKFEFQKHYKFSIACENQIYVDYQTEKIIDPFLVGSIPIYYGDKSVKKYFNPKSFIDYSDYSSDQEFIEYVKEIDTNDDKYLEMLNQPVFNDPEYIGKTYKKLEQFLLNIFNQPYISAFRRPPQRWFTEWYEKNLSLGGRLDNFLRETKRWLLLPFWLPKRVIQKILRLIRA